ncbi:unnamed protein product [Brassicogethes aeneus]|uniref:Uncharacterized protein n=1 Tax=Brassicogethes aeneus TaxID=1431903 RepID=A0A9P0AZJ5_BRAAE|nr:unnamed protein product [Brassicogethes aeneus]
MTDQSFKLPNNCCEHRHCGQEVFAACVSCLALLCWNHFELNDSCTFHTSMDTNEQSVSNKRKIPEDYQLDGAEKEVVRKKKERTNQKNIKKHLHLSGQGYVKLNSMNLVPPKHVKPPCKGKFCDARLGGRMCMKFSEDQRREILQDFYSLANLQQQREYLARHIQVKQTKQKTTQDVSRRNKSNLYYLPLSGEKVCVCKIFLLNTLNISEKTMRTSLGKIKETGIMDKERRGGRRPTLQKNYQRIREAMEKHIRRFPRVESHYCRANTTREYLHSDLSIPKMYALYLEDSDLQTPGSIITYRRVFKSQNLSFHSPKKDQCSLCATYRESSEEDKGKIQSVFNKHTEEKEKIRELKNLSKIRAMSDSTKLCAVFDLQQVIHLPL